MEKAKSFTMQPYFLGQKLLIFHSSLVFFHCVWGASLFPSVSFAAEFLELSSQSIKNDIHGVEKRQSRAKKTNNVRSLNTVDGSEIQRSPVEVGSLSHDLQGFRDIPGG